MNGQLTTIIASVVLSLVGGAILFVLWIRRQGPIAGSSTPAEDAETIKRLREDLERRRKDAEARAAATIAELERERAAREAARDADLEKEKARDPVDRANELLRRRAGRDGGER